MVFMCRMQYTLDMLYGDLASLRGTIEELKVSNKRSGSPTTLSPSDAAKFLSSRELSGLVGKHAKEQIAAIETAKATAVSELNRVRYTIATALRAPGISDEVRDMLRKISASVEAEFPSTTADPQVTARYTDNLATASVEVNGR